MEWNGGTFAVTISPQGKGIMENKQYRVQIDETGRGDRETVLVTPSGPEVKISLRLALSLRLSVPCNKAFCCYHYLLMSFQAGIFATCHPKSPKWHKHKLTILSQQGEQGPRERFFICWFWFCFWIFTTHSLMPCTPLRIGYDLLQIGLDWIGSLISCKWCSSTCVSSTVSNHLCCFRLSLQFTIQWIPIFMLHKLTRYWKNSCTAYCYNTTTDAFILVLTIC